MTQWIIGGLGLAVLLSAGAATWLFLQNGKLNEEVGRYKAATEVATDANKGKTDATKDRARTERDVRELPDPSLLEWMR